jgi:hypothetical protein
MDKAVLVSDAHLAANADAKRRGIVTLAKRGKLRFKRKQGNTGRYKVVARLHLPASAKN